MARFLRCLFAAFQLAGVSAMKSSAIFPFGLKKIPVSAWLFFGVFGIRLFSLAKLTESQFLVPHSGDMQFYNDWALRILGGHWVDHTAFYGLPLYAYLLATIYAVCGHNPFVPGLSPSLPRRGDSGVNLPDWRFDLCACNRENDAARSAIRRIHRAPGGDRLGLFPACAGLFNHHHADGVAGFCFLVCCLADR